MPDINKEQTCPHVQTCPHLRRNSTSKSISLTWSVAALVLGVIIGIFVNEPILSALRNDDSKGISEDYIIKELEVDYLQMLDGVKGVAFDVVNGVKCQCLCDDVHPEGGQIVYKFKGAIGDEHSKNVQRFKFNYTVTPIIVNSNLSCSKGEVSRVLLEPENSIVDTDGMKRLLNAFAVPQLKGLELYAPPGTFAVKELYSNLVVLKVTKER